MTTPIHDTRSSRSVLDSRSSPSRRVIYEVRANTTSARDRVSIMFAARYPLGTGYRWEIHTDRLRGHEYQQAADAISIPPASVRARFREICQEIAEGENTCEHCERHRDVCECYYCPGCDSRGPNLSICGDCGRCGDCCECRHCSRCDSRGPDLSVCGDCERCTDCCECRQCRRCDLRGPDLSVCGDCERCTDCCECCQCSRCDLRGLNLSVCGDCDGCDDCCECRHTKIPRRKRLDLTRWAKKNERRIGAEIEISGCDEPDALSDALETWGVSVVDDGSLPSTGAELVTSPYAAETYWPRAIGEIGAALRNAGAETTQACGLHVHVDASDLGAWDVRRLIRLYALIEPALFGMVAPSRVGSTYCQPCGAQYLQGLRGAKTRKPKAALEDDLYALSPSREAKNTHALEKYQSARYRALNTHSFFHRGTVEFRMHHGSINAEKITSWGRVCERVVSWSAAHTDREVDSLARSGLPTTEILRAVIVDGGARLDLEPVAVWARERNDELASPPRRNVWASREAILDSSPHRSELLAALGAGYLGIGQTGAT